VRNRRAINLLLGGLLGPLSRVPLIKLTDTHISLESGHFQRPSGSQPVGVPQKKWRKGKQQFSKYHSNFGGFLLKANMMATFKKMSSFAEIAEIGPLL